MHTVFIYSQYLSRIVCSNSQYKFRKVFALVVETGTILIRHDYLLTEGNSRGVSQGLKLHKWRFLVALL